MPPLHAASASHHMPPLHAASGHCCMPPLHATSVSHLHTLPLHAPSVCHHICLRTISVLTGCLTHLGPAGASWYNTLKLASCHVHRPCPNPLQSPHRVMTSKQESSTSLVSQFGKSAKC